MTFFRTEMLFFIWAVPLLFLVIFYGTRRRRDILHRFASAHGLAVIAPDTVGGRRWVKGVLLMGTVLFIAVALAGPRYGYPLAGDSSAGCGHHHRPGLLPVHDRRRHSA
jgi:Ca-activated chloride channel family protein